MKVFYRLIFVLVFGLSFFQLQAQQYFLYGSHTLAESSINPETEVFFGATCKRLAFNCFVPGVQAGGIFYGQAGTFLYDQNIFNKIAFGNYPLDQGSKDYLQADAHVNVFSLKLSTDLARHGEFLLDYQVRASVRSQFPNSIFSQTRAYGDAGDLSGYANTDSYYLSYNQLSLGYRMNLNEDLQAGVSFSYLSGIAAGELNLYNTTLKYGHSEGGGSNTYAASASGYLLTTQDKNTASIGSQFNSVQAYLPNFKNPGLNFSGGINYRLSGVSSIAFRAKDLGFILWRKAYRYDPQPVSGEISHTTVFGELNAQFKNVFKDGYSGNWNQRLPARLEGQYTGQFTGFLTSTLVISKPVYSTDAYVATVNDFHYAQFHGVVNVGYDTRKAVDLGLHLIYRSPSVEFFIGSERLNGLSRINYQRSPGANAGERMAADLSFGFAMRFGSCFNIQTSTNMHTDGKRPGFLRRYFTGEP